MKPERNIVLITGCNGRIGSAVMQRLTGHFSDVVGFDRNAPTPPLRWILVATREASIRRHARALPKMNAADYDALDRRVPLLTLLFSSGTYAVPSFARQTGEAGGTPFKIGDS